MDSLDRTVADILGESPDALSLNGRKAMRRSAVRRGATAAVLVLIVASVATFATVRLMPVKPPISDEARLSRSGAPLAANGKSASVVAEIAPAPEPAARTSGLSEASGAPLATAPAAMPPPPPPPDKDTFAQLREEAALGEPKIAPAPKVERLKVAPAERLTLSPSPRFDMDAPPRPVQLVWVRQPSPEEVDHVYPSDALIDGVPGSVELSCRERIDGSVDRCGVLHETPHGAGFGRAALKLSRSFRFTPYLFNGEPSEITVQIPYDFSVSD